MHFDPACRLKLKLHDEAGNLVAHCLLPHQFIVIANGNGNNTGVCELRVHPEPQPQVPVPGFAVPNPILAAMLDRRTPELLTNVRPVSGNQYSDNLNYPAPVLHRVSPAEGPMSGGQTILLSGTDFPQHPQQMVYARFGSVPVTTV